MSCSEFDGLLVRSDLCPDEAARLERHLIACEPCREAAALLGATHGEHPAPLGPQPTVALPPGGWVESFRIDGVIGRGGTSTVYAAAHPVTGQRVAIKVLDRRMLVAPDAIERFRRDARLVARLRGEHVCRVLTFGSLASGEPYMVLERLDGEDLLELVERSSRLSATTAVDMILQACAGLAEAHGRGIVHRDLKPANLFCVRRPDGSTLLKVLDFGIAKLLPTHDGRTLTETGAKLGSLPYMSPEQLRSSRAVDQRTDVWSLGATLYQLISGRLPFPSNGSWADLTLRIWTEAPSPLLEVPPGLAAVVARCLAKEPGLRYADVAELAHALAPHGDGDAAARAEQVGRILRTVAAGAPD